MSILKYIKHTDNFLNSKDNNKKFPTYTPNKLIGYNRTVFYSIPNNSKNLPVLFWFNTDIKKECYYNTEWWSNEDNYNNCSGAKHSNNGGYWLLDLYKKIQ